jgi:hemerythrin superfamily protein
MSTEVQKTVTVDVPVNVAYNQWTQFEDFPQFMGGVESVTQVTDDRLHWVAEIAGVRREWDATILEQVPDQKIAWAATEGATNAGAVYFEPRGDGQTDVRLVLEYEPEGLVEKAGDLAGIVERRAESDLEKFKAFVQKLDRPTGAWRGSVNPASSVGTPGVDAASASQGDSGKAGVSKTARVAGVAAAAAGAAAVAGAAKKAAGGTDSASGLDVTQILTIDHGEVTSLLSEIETSIDPSTKRDLADMVIAELVRHSVAEEMYVYPAIKKHLPNGAEAVAHDKEEHKEIERTLKKLEGLEPTDPAFATTIGELSATLQDHIRDEERDQFPSLRALVPHEELVEIGAKVEAAKKLAPTRPHPMAPNAAPFHKLAGPGVGLVDRLRDKLTGRSTG